MKELENRWSQDPYPSKNSFYIAVQLQYMNLLIVIFVATVVWYRTSIRCDSSFSATSMRFHPSLPLTLSVISIALSSVLTSIVFSPPHAFDRRLLLKTLVVGGVPLSPGSANPPPVTPRVLTAPNP